MLPKPTAILLVVLCFGFLAILFWRSLGSEAKAPSADEKETGVAASSTPEAPPKASSTEVAVSSPKSPAARPAPSTPSSAEPILLAQATAPVQPASINADLGASSSSGSAPIVITTADEAAAHFASAKTPAELLERADMSNPVVREFVVARMSELEESRYESVLAKATRLGIPTRIDGPGHKVSILHAFDGDRPIYRSTQNTNAAISSGANTLRDQSAPYGLDGTGIKVGVWDGGSVRNTHQEFNTTRVVKKNSTSPVDDHATHVAGTIGANGTTAASKGMAPKVAIDSYEWTNDYAEMTAAAAATATDTARIPLSNHSYGYNAVTADMGRYETECNTLDALAASLPYYLVFWAAGNEQDLLTALGGYQSITFNSLAKNILTVGAANDAVTSGTRDTSKGTIASFSSLGPCDDGRIKPDLVANGVSIYSPVSTTDTAYDGTYSGTSMATPSAAGSATLLTQLYQREFPGTRPRASMLKGLLIHTATDVGNPGPDYKYGWGYINVKAAADVILAHKSSLAAPKMIEGTLNNSTKTLTQTFQWDGSSPVRATLCWTDPAGTAQTTADSRTPNVKHNLDLKITAPNGSTTYLPFVMPFVGTWTQASMNATATTGVNKVDTVEQVLIAAPTQAGSYTATVSLNGTLTTASQIYSLVITGGSSVETNPPPSLTLDSPATGTAILPSNPVTLAATATDKALGGANGIVQSVQFFSGNISLGIDTTAPYSLTWTPPSPGTYSLTAVATDTEGASATSSVATLTVLSGNGAPAIASFSPATAAPGASLVLTGTNLGGATSVKFNAAEATSFTVNSNTQITAIAPSTATSGPLSVTTPFGTANSTTSFTLLQSPVLISQIYGAGGNSGALYNADFVEIHNRSASSVSLTGWSIQYTSASGTSWQATALAGSIAPGKYHLVKLSGGTTGSALPTPDSSGTVNMSGTNGKVALRSTATAFTGSSPIGQTGLQDLVGFGSANTYEGTGAAPSPSSTTAIFRAGGGATDSGDNKTDFTTSAPNPRNSSFGSATPPAITSPSTASGTVGQAFSYQITASNSPTSFAAANLPAGLAINTATGRITGTPTTAGTTNATLSATNTAGKGNATLAITIAAGGGGGGNGTQAFSEDFSSIITGDNTTTGGSGSAWTPNSNFTTVNRTYQAGGTVKIGSSSASGFVTTKSLDLSAGNYTVSFKVKGWTTIEGNLTVTPSGGTARTVRYTQTMNGTFETKSLFFSGGSANTTLTIATTAKRAFLDDIVITTGGTAPTPRLTADGTLSALSTTYGSASASTSFTVSGSDLAAGILVTAPSGFEVSQTANGTTGYAPTQTVGTSDTVGPTTLHLRLAAGTAADSYADTILCSSADAASVTLPVPSSTIRPKLLTITASDLTKLYGHTLAPGSSTYTINGLVGNETIGSTTLAATGGAEANDPVGAYEITPTAVTGGTFVSSNYDIYYVSGTLTVTAPTFAEWAANLSDPAKNADPDRDGIPNHLEYFLGLDATSPSSTGMIHTLANETLTLDYPRSKALSGSSGSVEWTTTFSTWSTANVTDSLLSENATHETRRATLPILPGETKKFLRLRVEETVP